MNQEDLQVRLKVEEMIHYAYAALRQFPKSEKHVLSAEIRQCMFRILRLVIICNRRYYKKTTMQDLDSELALLRKRLADRRMMAVIENIVRSYSEPQTPGKGLPIGNLTSQLFANIYMDAFDQWAKCRRRERWYARYMDDFVVIHHDKRHLQALRIDAERWLADHLDLATNRKTGVFPVSHKGGRGLDFLGYHLWPNARRLRKASLRRLSRQIRQWQAQYAAGEIDLVHVREHLHSWVNHARHGNAIPAVASMLKQATFRRSSNGHPGPAEPRRNPSRNPRRVGAQKAA